MTNKLKFGVLLILLFFLTNCKKENSISAIRIPNSLPEVDVHFFVHDSLGVYYSSNHSGRYELYNWKNGITKKVSDTPSNLFRPFLCGNNIGGLMDNNGSEEFSLYLGKNIRISDKTVRFLNSSKNGNYLVYQLVGDNKTYLLDLKRNKEEVLVENSVYFKASFSKDELQLVILTDQDLIYFDLTNFERRVLASSLFGKKYNPYIYGEKVFFSSNIESEYFRLYETSIANPEEYKVLLSGPNDLRLPKFDGKNVYFLEIEKGHYLMKKFEYPHGSIESITESGVVYDYDWVGLDSMAFIYSNVNVPRSLFINSPNGTHKVSPNDITELEIEVDYLERKNSRSSAYLLKTSSHQAKGIVCFFHGAPDYSPRWDPILSSLCNNGYYVIIPNFPGSFGYGKSYQNLPLEKSVQDIISWKKYLVENYDLPIHFLGLSQGSSLMEIVISFDKSNVSSYVSCFGSSNLDIKNKDIPGMYVLGKNDPLVSYRTNSKRLKKNGFEILSFPNEGHGIKHIENIVIAQKSILQFFNQHNN